MCSTVIFGNNAHRFLAENYDHSLDHGLVAVNLQGTVKENGREPGEKPIRWCVKYGSVTFNQFSLELPVSGMNETGLAVALMWHYEGDFGNDDRYARLSALQWIQYQLDNFRSVAEVLDGLETMRPKQEGVPLHYTLLDAENNSLLLEFIGGEPKAYIRPEFPILTNTSYPICLEQATEFAGREGVPENGSIARFVCLYRQVQKLDPDSANVSDAFALLQSVNQTPTENESFPWNRENGNNTVTAWSIVFDPTESAVFFKTHGNDSLREIRLSDVDFEKTAEYLVMDINKGTQGGVLPLFQPYAREHNQQIVRRTAGALNMPPSVQDGLIELVDRLYRDRKMRLA